jgi:hypothetical protein
MKAPFGTALLLALNLNIYAQNLLIARFRIDATKGAKRRPRSVSLMLASIGSFSSSVAP